MRFLSFFFRLWAIGLVSTGYGLRYVVARAGTLFVFDRERRRQKVAQMRGHLLRLAMTRLGATFIKLGQVMSSRPDIFEPELIAELRQLQDSLPAFPFSEVEVALEAQLHGPQEEVFSSIDRVPVAAASVAQVHRAVLARDGSEVAIKVLRPDIRAKVERDASIMRVGAKLLALHPSLRLSDPVGHLEHFVDGIIDQTDLRLEAKNSTRFRANFADDDMVIFPKVHEDLSGPHIMVMEFVRGTKVDALGAGDHGATASRVGNMFLKMCMIDGFVHADLHPGNFLVMDDGRIAVFDLGLVKELSENLLLEFIDFTKVLTMGGPKDIVEHMKTFHTYMGSVDWDAMTADSVDLFTDFRTMSKSELEFGKLFDDIFALGRKYKVRPITDFTLIIVGLITAEGVGKMLDPHTNSFEQVAQYLLPILMERGIAVPAPS